MSSQRLARQFRLHAPSLRPPSRSRAEGVVSTGWAGVDAALGGGLVPGVVHEWFGSVDATAPPLMVLKHLARCALSKEHVFWIGRSVWWQATASCGDDDLIARSVFVDPPDHATRLWAIDLCLRSPAVAVVVADGRALSMAASRRLQLAAEAGNTVALLARPPSERGTLSAAATRWQVHRTLAPGEHENECDRPRWMLELLRCKGRARGHNTRRISEQVLAWADFYVPNAETQRWMVEWNSATGVVSELSELVDRPVAAQEPPSREDAREIRA